MFRRGLTWLRGARPRPARLLALVALLLVIGLGLTLAGGHAWAGDHLRDAERALGRYRLPEARGHLARCLRAWPRHFRAHLLAAQTARRLDDFEAAERHLARCQEIRGGLPDAVVLEQTLLRAQRGGMDPMTPYLRSLVEYDHPATPLILEAMARGYLRASRYLDAAAVLAVWLGRDPDDVQANFMLGWVREQIGPQQQAVDNYRRVVEVDPEHE